MNFHDFEKEHHFVYELVIRQMHNSMEKTIIFKSSTTEMAVLGSLGLNNFASCKSRGPLQPGMNKPKMLSKWELKLLSSKIVVAKKNVEGKAGLFEQHYFFLAGALFVWLQCC